MHVGGASTVLIVTHVIPTGRSHSFCYGCPHIGCPQTSGSTIRAAQTAALGHISAYSEAQTCLRYPQNDLNQ